MESLQFSYSLIVEKNSQSFTFFTNVLDIHFIISLFNFVPASLRDTVIDIIAPEYNAAPTNRLPLNPIIIDKMAVKTVPITDAMTFTPHSSVTSPCRLSVPRCLLSFCANNEDILTTDGN